MQEMIKETEAEQMRKQNAVSMLFDGSIKCLQTYLIMKRHETGNLKQPELCSLPSVRQEVDLDIRVPRSAIVPDRKFFSSKHGDDQLMTNFVVPQLQLQETIRVKMGPEPPTAEPGWTQNPGEAVTADNTTNAGHGTLAGPHISRALKTFARPYRNQFKESSCRTTGEPQKTKFCTKEQYSQAEESKPNHFNLRLEERNRNN